MLTVAAIVVALLLLPVGWGVALVAAALVVDVTETVVLVRWSRRRRVTVGLEAMVGRTGVASGRLAPAGQVRIDGEIWDAVVLRDSIEPGATVVVRSVDGLTLRVDPA
jgi:membrane protein implicated in regulation of membrane protease activity